MSFRFSTLIVAVTLAFASPCLAAQELTAPKLTNNPSWDVVVTNARPLLTILNAEGGMGELTYTYQISPNNSFPTTKTIKYTGIHATNRSITEKRMEESDKLLDGIYWWRARAMDAEGTQGPWSSPIRFHVETVKSRTFMELTRAQVAGIKVSSWADPKNIIDWSDEGQATFWNSTPPGNSTSWVALDFGKTTKISRFWMLSSRHTEKGWLKNFVWQSCDKEQCWASPDQDQGWKNIPGSNGIHRNKTFRNIIDFSPVEARYFRLKIFAQQGLQAQINAIIPYSPGMPAIPETPDRDYVLVVGNQMNGFTYTMLAKFIEDSGLGLATVTVPHWKVSMKMLEQIKRKPIAIVLSGSNAEYPDMPMFEFYGEFEMIRKTDIPILGICAGHQFLTMAYGLTFVRSMGWTDDSTFGLKPQIRIRPEYKADPIFSGIPNPFSAVEIHSWAVSPVTIPDGYVITSETGYIQTLQSEKKTLFGSQFHGEVKLDYNQGGSYITNFLKIALKKTPRREL